MKTKTKSTKYLTVVIMHNVRSVHNVGAMVRTANAMGVQKIIFTGYTPTPVDRFGRTRKDFAKASLGAENFLKWEKASSFSTTVKNLKKERFTLIAIEQTTNAIDVRKTKVSGNIAFVVGNEVSGLSKRELALCDIVSEIPMQGLMVRQIHHPHHTGHGKESLNVGAALAVVLFQILHNRV